METLIVDVVKLEKLVEKINEETLDVQDSDHQLGEAVRSIFDALDVLKDRAGLGDDSWRKAA